MLSMQSTTEPHYYAHHSIFTCHFLTDFFLNFARGPVCTSSLGEAAQKSFVLDFFQE